MGEEHQEAGFVLKNLDGAECVYTLKYNFYISNNELEYEAPVASFCMTLAMNMDQLIIHRDSQIVHRNITGMFEAKEKNKKKYSELAKALLCRFKCTDFEKLSRRNNQKAPIQSFIGEPNPRGIVEPLARKSINKEILCITPESNWMTLIKDYIWNCSLSDDDSQAWKDKTIVARYVIHVDQLYWTMGNWPLLKCITCKEGNYIFREVHEGICGAHIGTNSFVQKIM